jgi:uncharacterized repeat protein (TIGR03803 family)
MKLILNLLAASFLALFLTVRLPAQNSEPTITQLFEFVCNSKTGVCPDGKAPNSLLQSADGNFYGTTTAGGIGNNAAGTVFKITPSGQLSLLHTFVADANGDYPNGEFPISLVEGNDGFLYGTAGGGANNGLVFKLSKTGKFEVLNSAVGVQPFSLILGRDGDLYGATLNIGLALPGTLFRITPTGSYTLLHTFNSSFNGPLAEGPRALGITLASDGNLYGTTVGRQTIITTFFRLTPAGVFDVFFTFHYAQFPVSAPVQDSNGNLYASLSRFEDKALPGLFETNLSGSNPTQIALPFAFVNFMQNLTPTSDSNLWGILFQDDPNASVVSISPIGALLQSIALDGTNGAAPDAPLVQAPNGKFFGVTQAGGKVEPNEVASGVVFTLNAGLPASKAEIVNLNPSRGTVGSQIMIQGTHFVGTTAVTFNGLNAAFKVLNTGNILAIVPEGASTGPIGVTNPGGASNEATFTVE